MSKHLLFSKRVKRCQAHELALKNKAVTLSFSATFFSVELFELLSYGRNNRGDNDMGEN